VTAAVLKAPWPYPGGKSKIAPVVWQRFGDTPNFVEPFLGSAAVLLARPPFEGNRIETVNDADGHVANFWRALQADPNAVAYYADWPVSELDMQSRGTWLYYRPSAREWVEQLRADPEFYDAKSAGWWAWFVSCWIGALPQIHGRNQAGTPETGLYSVRPHLGDAGKGVARQLPHLGSGGQGNGVHGNVKRQLPATNIGGVAAYGNGNGRRAFLTAYLRQLAARLERVRVICGDWTRVTGPSVTWKHGVTAVFLDPPYSQSERHAQLYSTESDVAADVRQWCLENGDNPLLRIALCGYSGEGHEVLEAHGWHAHAWKANGGYGSQGKGRGRANKHREVIYFSPHCLNPVDSLPLFRAHANGDGARSEP
jgi:DNA adenine methylase